MAGEESRHATASDKRYEDSVLVYGRRFYSKLSWFCRSTDEQACPTAHGDLRNRERQAPRKDAPLTLTNNATLIRRRWQFGACDPAGEASRSVEKHVQHSTCWRMGQNADKERTMLIGSTAFLKDNGGDGGASSKRANLENGRFHREAISFLDC